MALHASWKGHLRLSLVSLPLQAFTVNAGSSGSEISFHQLHKPCKNRIQYRKFCPVHGEVSQDEIVSGYEIEKDHYVVLDPKEIDALRDSKDESINIEGFVSPDTIDPRYLAGQAYYLVPDGNGGEKPFELIRRGLEEEHLHGIGRFVISRRQRLVRLRATSKLLLLDVLHYSSELKPAEDFESTH
ncbi:MAG: Ku protein [Planctomycetales bacterium]